MKKQDSKIQSKDLKMLKFRFLRMMNTGTTIFFKKRNERQDRS